MELMFTEWNPQEIAGYETAATIDEIHAILVKNKS